MVLFTQSLTPPYLHSRNRDPVYDLRAKYTRFRILVIGRANAGKTTLLQRVCNTTEDPCLHDDDGKNLLEPTSARGKHDIRRPFAFKSNPGFIFHDSPGFETGDEKQLQDVLSFIEEKEKSTDVDDQLHAIWFCFVLNKARPLFPLETAFFETTRAGKVPVIAIFTKFDDLMNQIYDVDLDDDVNRRIAEEEVEKKFRKPLSGYAYPPRADVCFEALHSQETGKHQHQVKALIEKTASSLDDTALKMLFVSVQQNNIKLCIQYAIDMLLDKIGNTDTEKMVWRTMLWFGHSFNRGYNYGKTEYLDYDRRGGDGYGYGYDQSKSLAVFLASNFQCDGPHSSHSRRMSSLFMFTALLICMENSFWNHGRHGTFVDSFKKSFTLYVESGMKKKVESHIDGLKHQQAGKRVVDEKELYEKIIIKHCLSRSDQQAAVSN